MLSCLADYRGFMARGKENSPRETAFAQWLTDARVSRGLTMSGLAQKMGLTSHARISQLEKGDEPTPKMIRQIANALVTEVSDDETAERLYREGMSLAFGMEEITRELSPEALQVAEAFDGADEAGRKLLESAAEMVSRAMSKKSIGRNADDFGARSKDEE